MKVQEFDPKEVLHNPAIAARRGTPDPTKVKKFAENFMERRDAGRIHQIQPGLVRYNDKDKPEVIVGRHRLEGCKYLNANLIDGMEPFKFIAIAVPSSDTQALIDAIQENCWRVAENVFDKADAMERLMALDPKLTQDDVARSFNLSKSSVSGILKAGKLNKKTQAVLMGNSKNPEWTEEAIIKFATYAGDEEATEEMLELAQAQRDARIAIEERAEARRKAAEEEEAAAAGEPDEAETGKKKSSKKASAPVSDAVKNKNGKKTPTKVTGSDVAAAARTAGKAKRAPKKKPQESRGRGKAALLTFLEANFGSKAQDAPKSCKNLAAKIEEFFDEECDEKGLKRSFLHNCLSDPE